MRYDFRCKSCNESWELKMKASEFKEIKEEGVPCISCDNGIGYNEFNPGNLQVCYTGFQWADKNYKEKAYRKDRAKVMDHRQSKNNFKPELRPNYKGEVTKSWKEAREAARSDGKFADSYNNLVKEENKK